MVNNKATLTYDIGLTETEIEFFELVGMQLYVEYGYDRYDYSKNGMPVNIPLIKEDYYQALKLEYIIGYESIRSVALGIARMYESDIESE